MTANYDISYALKGYQISNTAKVIWGYLNGLARASENQGLPYVYAGHRKIAERVGVCERTVCNAMKQLRAVGLISVKRRGQGLNSRTFVNSPSVNPNTFTSRSEKMSFSNIKTERVIKYPIEYHSIPTNDKDNAPSAQIINSVSVAGSKGKPTNKRPRINYEAKKKAKQRYKEHLYQRLKVNELKEDWTWVSDFEGLYKDIDSIEKLIELIASIASGKGKIMVSGALLTSQAWWYGVKNITQDRILDALNRVYNASNVKNRKAYLLATLYNEGIQEAITQNCHFSRN